MLDYSLAEAPVYRWVVALAIAGLVTILSLTPVTESYGKSPFGWLLAITAPRVQKVLHVVAYSVLAFTWMWALAHVQPALVRGMLTVVLATGIGALFEWCQTRIPGRFGNAFDVLLNAFGSVAGVLLALVVL